LQFQANHFDEALILEEENFKIVNNADFYYILSVAKIALERNKPFIVSLSAPFISQFFKKPLMEAMPFVDMLSRRKTLEQRVSRKSAIK
jgi:adenosine kinase